MLFIWCLNKIEEYIMKVKEFVMYLYNIIISIINNQYHIKLK